MERRPATIDDLQSVVETIALAFRADPVWGVALEAPNWGEEHLRPFWSHYVEGGLRHGGVYVGGEAETVSVWIPPGETELSPAQEVALHEMVEGALEPARARAIFELFDRFEAHHPRGEPHGYLSLLATRPDRAGHGYGQAHLAADLLRWDAAGVPTYLESTNPVNNRRYERQGFVRVGQFETILDAAPVTTMWRPVGG